MKFQEFGWNGLFFEVPEEMNFTRQGGNAKSGSLMLEAEDYLVEAKWEPFEPKKVKPLSAVAESMVKQMKDKSKKREIAVLRQEDSYVSAHKALFMVIKSEVEDRIYMWYCDESQRVIILRFLFKTFDESSKKMMKHMFDTLKCHSEKSNIWSLLSFHFEAPVSFLLAETKITVGRAHFMLTDHKLSSFAEKSARILVEYVSMANLMYKDTYKDPDKWLEQHYLKDLRKHFKEGRMKFETLKTVAVKRHTATIKQGTRKSGVTSRKTIAYTNATWYCSGLNRIYSVTVMSTIIRPPFFKREVEEEAHTKLLEDLLASIKCH